jgi:hypothetical protein
MNKLKVIGISALAGTLVSLSAAQAGGVSVSGVYELSYTTLDHRKTSGNKLGVKKNISFGAGGDLSDGGGVTWASNIGWTDGADLSSASIAINMGGIATLTYDSGGGGTGANAVDNIVPTAWEEVDYGLKTGISDLGAVSASKGVVNLTVKAPVSGTGFSLSYVNRMGGDHVSDGGVQGVGTGVAGVDLVLDVVDYDAAHFGFRWGMAAQTELHDVTCERNNTRMKVGTTNSYASCNDGLKHNPYGASMFTKLQLGPIHLGTQATFKNLATTKSTAIMNTRSIVSGAALVFGDTLSLSYGVAWDKNRYNDRNRGLGAQAVAEAAIANECTYGASDLINCREIRGGDEHEYITTKYRGWSAALNIGPVALKGTTNHADSGEKSGIYEHGTSHSELNLSIAF